MMLHLGNDQGVAWQNIIAILNLSSLCEDTQKYLRGVNPEHVFYVSPNDTPKSVVLAAVEGATCLYYSTISSSALLRRSVEFQQRLTSN